MSQGFRRNVTPLKQFLLQYCPQTTEYQIYRISKWNDVDLVVHLVLLLGLGNGNHKVTNPSPSPFNASLRKVVQSEELRNDSKSACKLIERFL